MLPVDRNEGKLVAEIDLADNEKLQSKFALNAAMLSCIIVTYYPDGELIDCIKSLQRFVQCPYEIILSDNTVENSKILEQVEIIFPDIIVRRNPVNGGFSYGNNRGVERATGAYLMLLNPDAQLLSPVTSEMVAQADYSGIIAGVSQNSAGIYKRTVGRFPVKPAMVFSLTGRMDQRSEIVSGNFRSRFVDIEYNEGSCYLIRRDVFQSVGGFDERIFLYGEDYEFSYRVSRSGRNNRLDSSLHYLHDGGYSDQREPHIVNGLIYFSRKHFGRSQELKMRIVLLARYTVLLATIMLRWVISSKARKRLSSVLRALHNVLIPNPYLAKPPRVEM